ncbi:MAG: flavin reductase family protein [Oscillospiraceae bacterium]|nr:flavin reductase family protein [Oscillospiraceae bacterium]
MVKEVNVWDYAGHIMETIGSGILLTTAYQDKVNTMTIGWGQLGVVWSKPVFSVLVRESRYTKEFLDKTGEFTVNIPLAKVDKNIIALCGTKSGRELDKFQALNLTAVPGQSVSVPGIRELPLTLECKVIYRQDQDPKAIEKTCFDRFYAAGTHNEGDYHTVYYGEITKAYIIEE